MLLIPPGFREPSYSPCAHNLGALPGAVKKPGGKAAFFMARPAATPCAICPRADRGAREESWGIFSGTFQGLRGRKDENDPALDRAPVRNMLDHKSSAWRPAGRIVHVPVLEMIRIAVLIRHARDFVRVGANNAAFQAGGHAGSILWSMPVSAWPFPACCSTMVPDLERVQKTAGRSFKVAEAVDHRRHSYVRASARTCQRAILWLI